MIQLSKNNATLPKKICRVLLSGALILAFCINAGAAAPLQPTASAIANQSTASAAAQTAVTQPNAYFHDSVTAALQELNIPEFLSSQQVDGRGLTVAVLDTGIDPSHPDLQFTSYGDPKVSAWADMTDEGLVQLDGEYDFQPDENVAVINVAGTNYTISRKMTKSGKLYFGLLKEANLPATAPCTGGFNCDQDKTDTYLVLLCDIDTPGSYDSVFVDANGNQNVFDDDELPPYNTERKHASFTDAITGKTGISFVISDINLPARTLKIGFDGNSHGTRVAGIIGAYGGGGSLAGVSPAVQLMSIKIANSSGETDWDTIRQGIHYAVDHGADIVNLSLGSLEDSIKGSKLQEEEINQLVESRHLIFVAAIGNDGPFLGTVSSPADVRDAIGVGAYITPQMRTINDMSGSRYSDLLYYSSRGPRPDGLIKPNIVAPGVSWSTNPLWTGFPYIRCEGSSVATPFIAGSCALLLDGAKKLGVSATPQKMIYALEQSCQPVSGYTVAEQGHGAPDIAKAFQLLGKTAAIPPVSAVVEGESGDSAGLFLKNTVPGQIPVRVSNNGSSDLAFELQPTDAWLDTKEKRMLLPAGSSREFTLAFLQGIFYGAFSGAIDGIDDFTGISGLRVDSTIIRPYDLSTKTQYEIKDSTEAGRTAYYFFRVPQGKDKLTFKLAVEQVNGQYAGRVRMHIAPADGSAPVMTGFAGGLPGVQGKDYIEQVFAKPAAGLWQLVVYASSGTITAGMERSEFLLSAQEDPQTLSASSTSSGGDPAVWAYFYRKNLVAGKTTMLTLNVRNKTTLEKLTGWAEINGVLYKLTDGKVIFPYSGSDGIIRAVIRADGYKETKVAL